MNTADAGPYTFGDTLPVNGVHPGTTLFVSGPSMSGARDVALAMTLPEMSADERSTIVSTTTGPGRLIRRAEQLAPTLDPSMLAIIDGSGRSSGDTQSARVESVSGPGDLTGIGIRLSKLFEAHHTNGITRIRTGVISVSTLLMYVDVRTAFRFLHSLAGRIAAIGGVGIFYIDPTSHDTESTNMLTQLADGRIEVREAEDNQQEGELRVRGLPDQSRRWTPFSLGQEVQR